MFCECMNGVSYFDIQSDDIYMHYSIRKNPLAVYASIV